MTDLTKMLDSMENALKMQIHADAERRAEKAKQEETLFKEKLMRAAASEVELDGLSARIKGSEDAVRRDQLMALMMAGL